LQAVQNKRLEDERKEFEYPNFDLDVADELSVTLILKTDSIGARHGTIIFRTSEWVREVQHIVMHINLIELFFFHGFVFAEVGKFFSILTSI
jgi:hypothetical protein